MYDATTPIELSNILGTINLADVKLNEKVSRISAGSTVLVAVNFMKIEKRSKFNMELLWVALLDKKEHDDWDLGIPLGF
jgi:hypothetical protein